VNLVLFEPAEIGGPLAAGDPRALHILEVLRRRPGDLFDAGVVNGPRGRGRVVASGPGGLEFAFEAGVEASPPETLHLLVALPRPQTARKIIGAATALGVASMRFFASEKGEPGYASSALWRTGEWRRHLVDGASQAFDTRIPEVTHHPDLAAAVGSIGFAAGRIALDNYEAGRRLAPLAPGREAVLAFGPERGWSASERDLLRSRGFGLAHLGTRVLRTETAVVAAIAVAKAAG
jgi:RsmE family RNA methyltransferase